MMAEIGFVAPTKTRITFSVDPARNALTSLLLLSEDVSGLGGWVEETAAALGEDTLEAHHRLLKSALGQLQGKNWSSFMDWVDELAARDPHELVYNELGEYARRVYQKMGDEFDTQYTAEQLLADQDAYLDFHRTICHYSDCEFDPAEYEAEFATLHDPATRWENVVNHLRTMWDKYLADEWECNLPLLEDSVAAFESLDLDSMTTAEAIRRVLDRDEPAQWAGWRDDVTEIIFIPSAHVSPYLLMIEQTPTKAWVVFGARIPEGATVHSPGLRRSELLVRLSALADDTRLRILALLAEADELETRTIQDSLDLSKSAASRHLRQLTASGYVIVRQHEKSNFYRLNAERFADTWQALKAFLHV